MSNQRFAVHIQSGNKSIVKVQNFELYENHITFLFGESGIGKSMISKAVYGMLDPSELSVTINNQEYPSYLSSPVTQEIKKNSFIVFQEPSSHLNSLLKISEQLDEGSLSFSTAQGDILKRLWQSTDANGINNILKVYPKPYRPSGGEKQRVLLAMAFKKIDVFISNAKKDAKTFFVFDEPTGSLDNIYRNLFFELLFEQYKRYPFTILIITHDYSVISELHSKYRSLLDRTHFAELRRSTYGTADVEVHEFSTDAYLSWLSQNGGSPHDSLGGDIILDFCSRFTVFNRNLCLYQDSAHTKPANLCIKKGEMVYVKAPSGVGKTSLSKVILGLYKSEKFSMTLCGMPISEKTTQKVWQQHIWGKKAGMVFQHADESLDLNASVKETFDGLPLATKMTTEKLHETLLQLFEGPIHDSFLSKKVGMLSGGQKQRLNLLRTLVLGTDLIILDEPLNGLDFVSVKKVMLLLEEKKRNGSALLLISHNEEIFDAFVDQQHTYYLAEEE